MRIVAQRGWLAPIFVRHHAAPPVMPYQPSSVRMLRAVTDTLRQPQTGHSLRFVPHFQDLNQADRLVVLATQERIAGHGL